MSSTRAAATPSRRNTTSAARYTRSRVSSRCCTRLLTALPQDQEILVRQERGLVDQAIAGGFGLLEEIFARHLVLDRWADGELALVEVDVDEVRARFER